MRWLARAAVALAVLAAAALGVLLWALPRLAGSDAARARIEEVARSVLGRELRYGAIDFGLLPPSLVVTEPALAGDGADAPPLARAERVALRVELVPLLRRRLEVSSLVIDGLALHLVRDEGGLALPGPAPQQDPGAATPPSEPAPSEPPDASGGSDGSDGEPGILLGIRTIRLRDASLLLEDRSVSPPVSWSFEDVDVTARGVRPDAPVSIDGALRLGSGGELELEGSAARAGPLDLTLTLREVELSAARPYVDAETLSGRLGGTVRLAGAAASPELAARLRVEDADLALAAAQVRGALALEADLADAIANATGPFSIDADGAEIRYRNDFHKPPGTRARLRGTIVTDSQGALGADALVLELRNAVATGQLRSGDAAALRAQAEPFALDGWEELVPPLGLAAPRGRLAIPQLELGRGPEPARGLFVLDGLELTLPERAPLALTGEVAWAGATLRTRGARLQAAGQPFTLDGSLEQIYTEPRYELRFETLGADANALLAGFAGQPDRLHGPLQAKGVLRGTLGGDTALLDALAGDLTFSIAGGRIVGTSLLEAALGPIGARLAEAGRQRDPERWRRFTGEQFELLDGALRIARGAIVAEPVSLRYRDYGARLEGPIRLEDLGLDLRGTLEIEELLDAELARGFGAKEGYVPQRRVIPLASVGGNLGAPKVQIAGSAVATLAATYAGHIEREELKRRVEEQFGAGAGEVVEQGLGVLEGLLGGRRKAAEPPPAEAPPQGE